MPNRDLYIAHFDDEPLTVEWLPGALLDYLIDLDPIAIDENDIKEEHQPVHGGYHLEFSISEKGKKSSIVYEIIPEQELYLEVVKKRPPDIAILDLMKALGDGGIAKAGIDIYNYFVGGEIFDSTLIILHTAYPEATKQLEGNLDLTHADTEKLKFFPKPADGDRMVRVIAQNLSERFSNYVD